MASNGKTRMTLEFPADVEERLERLMRRTNATSKADVLRKAIVLLDLSVTAHEDGKKVGVVEDSQPMVTEFVGL